MEVLISFVEINPCVGHIPTFNKYLNLRRKGNFPKDLGCINDDQTKICFVKKNCIFVGAKKGNMQIEEGANRLIYDSISNDGFSAHTLQLIDNYINDILNGRTNIPRFNIQEHAGICSANSVLIGAYTIACYARRSLETSSNVATSKGSPTNWEIDEKQEVLVQQWAEAKHLWIPNS